MNWVSFLTYTILCAYTPGPNNIIVMSSASSYGLKKSFSLVSGICTGFMSVMFLCSLFSVGLASFIPAVEPVMKYLGGFYILYLSYGILMSGGGNGNTGVFKVNTFKKGFLLQFINVKVILYGITAITTFVMPYNGSGKTILLFTLILTFIGWSGTFIWAIFGVVFYRYFQKYSRMINVLLAVLLSYSSLSLIF